MADLTPTIELGTQWKAHAIAPPPGPVLFRQVNPTRVFRFGFSSIQTGGGGAPLPKLKYVERRADR